MKRDLGDGYELDDDKARIDKRAVHRWLSWRLPGYDYDAHVAGACYPFLRGVDGEAAAEGGAAHGVFVDRPPRARIEALDRLFAQGGA